MYGILEEYDGMPCHPKTLHVVLNTCPEKNFNFEYRHTVHLTDLLRELDDRWGLRTKKGIRIFNAEGVEYDQNDLKYLKQSETIYVSRGEEFDPNCGFCQYQLLKTIGQGGYGTVSLGRHKATQQLYAIKIMKADKITNALSIDQVFREVENLKALRHPNIVRIENCYALKQMKVVLIMEYLEGGELREYLDNKGRLSLQDSLALFKQIVSAINYCHSKNIVHRDLKLENVLFKDKISTEVKIADFGIAGIAQKINPDIDCGTLKYMCPQVLEGKEKENSTAADIWAMGCIFYYMLFGRLPFVGKTVAETKALIVAGEIKIPEDIMIPKNVQKLFSKQILEKCRMFQKSSKLRIKTPMLYDAICQLQSGVAYEENKTEESQKCQMIKLNPETQPPSINKFRKELRYRRLRPLQMQLHNPTKVTPQSNRVSMLVTRNVMRHRSPHSEKKKQVSFRERIIMTPANRSRIKSRQSIFEIRSRF